MTAFEKVRALFQEGYGVEVTPDTAVRDVVVDSLEAANLALELEEEFGIDIPDEQMHQFVFVRDIVSYTQVR